MPRAIDAAAVTEAVTGQGSPYAAVQVHASAGSTNAEVRADPVLWVAVVADEQTAGLGRLGRTWSTPPGRALAVSVLVPATTTPAWLPLAAGLAVKAAVEQVTTLRPVLKWPNDVLLPSDGHRKVAGILCELLLEGVIVGTGLNVAQTREELPVDTATSLAIAGAPGVDRDRLLTAYLLALAEVHELVSRDVESARVAYEAACATPGSDVDVHLPGGQRLRGRATGVDAAGRLVVAGPSGEQRVAAGDVVHVRPAERGE